MIFLAPWALVVGVAAATAAVLLHLVAQQRPATYLLPTARFLPETRSTALRLANRPRDLLLLALRITLLLVIGAAFARPVFTARRVPVARIVLYDISRAQGSPADAAARVRRAASADVPTTVIAFDTVATVIAAAAADSAVRSVVRAPGSLSVGLLAARRAAIALAARAESVELMLVSPLAASAWDSATAVLRQQWPGRVQLERTILVADTAAEWQLDRRVALADPLGPALADMRNTRRGTRVRLVRAELSSQDTAFARNGGTVVWWSTPRAGSFAAEGLAVGGEVIVARLARVPVREGPRVIARWADGSPAAAEMPLGAGCVRHVGVLLPVAGDLPLHPAFQSIVRNLMVPCGFGTPDRVLDSASVAVLAGSGGAAPASAFAARHPETLPLVRWLLAVAIALACAELIVRARTHAAESA